MRDLIGYSCRMDRCDRIAATYDRNRSSILRHRLGHLECASGEAWNFENSHRSVPDNGSRATDFFAEELNRLRSDVERHLVGGDRLALADLLRYCIRLRFHRHNVIDRQQEPQIA